MLDRRSEVRACAETAQAGIKIINAALSAYEDYKHGYVYLSGELEQLQKARTMLRLLNIVVNTLVLKEEMRLDA